jgi:uncharacterized protein (UPF0276 family)
MPFLGFGLGLRPDYYEEILEQKPPLDWFELITENYMIPGGKPLYYLDQIRAHYPVVLHGVSLSLGSSDPLDRDYLQQLKRLIERVEPVWVSDHLCWTGVKGINTHDLLPLPYTPETVAHVVSRIQQVQEFLSRPLLIENVSSYLTYKHSELSEWEFIHEIVTRAGCFILLDVNNVYVSSINHEFDPLCYIRSLPKERVAQIHLAGHSDHGDYLIDTHDAPVIEPVWNLYAATIAHLGTVSTMIERDDNMPVLSELMAEVNHARSIAQRVLLEEGVA